MGVHNLAKLISLLGCKSDETFNSFDSLLIDIQSIIYSKLISCPRILESDIIDYVCCKTYEWFLNLLGWVMEEVKISNLVVVIAFDGKAENMKFPVQRQRRLIINNNDSSINEMLKNSIYECNHISLQVANYFEEQLSHANYIGIINFKFHYHFIIHPCTLVGEGEMKLFKMCSLLQLERPLFFSIDNDMFIIASARKKYYKNIQIMKSISKIYDIDKLNCHADNLLFIACIFGNDFYPALVQLSDANIHDISKILLELPAAAHSEELPQLLFHVIQKLLSLKKIRFVHLDFFSDRLVIEYFKCIFWVLDYYSLSKFPQIDMPNVFYDHFDRNQILSAFMHLDIIQKCFRLARVEYKNYKKNESESDSLNAVFSNEQKQKLAKYLIPTPKQANLVLIEWKN